MLNLRVRSSSKGNQHLSIAADSTFAALQTLIEQNTGVPPNLQKVLSGFPPKEVACPPQTSLTLAGISNNDTVTLEVRPSPLQSQHEAPAPSSTSMPTTEPKRQKPTRDVTVSEVGVMGSDGVIVRRVVNSDNSCLFNSIGYTLENRDRSVASRLRKVISDTILSDPDEYNEAVLGKSNSEYSKWILKDTSWGGGIELAILSDYYQAEISAHDIQTTNVYNYGEGKQYKQRVFTV